MVNLTLATRRYLAEVFNIPLEDETPATFHDEAINREAAIFELQAFPHLHFSSFSFRVSPALMALFRDQTIQKKEPTISAASLGWASLLMAAFSIRHAYTSDFPHLGYSQNGSSIRPETRRILVSDMLTFHPHDSPTRTRPLISEDVIRQAMSRLNTETRINQPHQLNDLVVLLTASVERLAPDPLQVEIDRTLAALTIDRSVIEIPIAEEDYCQLDGPAVRAQIAIVAPIIDLAARGHANALETLHEINFHYLADGQWDSTEQPVFANAVLYMLQEAATMGNESALDIVTRLDLSRGIWVESRRGGYYLRQVALHVALSQYRVEDGFQRESAFRTIRDTLYHLNSTNPVTARILLTHSDFYDLHPSELATVMEVVALAWRPGAVIRRELTEAIYQASGEWLREGRFSSQAPLIHNIHRMTQEWMNRDETGEEVSFSYQASPDGMYRYVGMDGDVYAVSGRRRRLLVDSLFSTEEREARGLIRRDEVEQAIAFFESRGVRVDLFLRDGIPHLRNLLIAYEERINPDFHFNQHREDTSILLIYDALRTLPLDADSILLYLNTEVSEPFERQRQIELVSSLLDLRVSLNERRQDLDALLQHIDFQRYRDLLPPDARFHAALSQSVDFRPSIPATVPHLFGAVGNGLGASGRVEAPRVGRNHLERQEEDRGTNRPTELRPAGFPRETDLFDPALPGVEVLNIDLRRL